MIWEDERWTKAQAWGCPCHPQHISKKYKRQSLGMPKASPSSSTKISGFFQNTIFLFLHMICVILGASFYFAFSFVLFACLNKWLDPSILCLERNTLRFHCLEHSSFHSYYSVSVQFLLTTMFSSCLSFLFCSELTGLLSIYMIISLVFDKYFLWKLFQINWLVL